MIDTTQAREKHKDRYFVFCEDGSGYHSFLTLKDALQCAHAYACSGDKVTVETKIYKVK